MMTPPLADFAKSDSAVIRNMRWRASAKRIATNLNFRVRRTKLRIKGTTRKLHERDLEPICDFCYYGRPRQECEETFADCVR